jgi:SulP family sulfate permease
MDRVSLMDQSGAYALQDALVDLKSSGMRIVLVGLPVAQRDILEAIHVIPDLVSTEDMFANFAELKAALPKMLTEIGAAEQGSVAKNEAVAT